MNLKRFGLAGVLALVGAVGACSSDDGGGGGGGSCPTADQGFEAGDPTGHADPFGAKAAGQARAGRVATEAMVVQPAHGRQRINVGDFVLANEKIAVYIEDKGISDGYARFGGEILAVDRVGDDGKPLGTSHYGETLMALSLEMINPDSVSVINDGSDGKAAVVRAAGRLEALPFLDGSLGALFPRRYGLMAAYDYVLEPGAEKLLIRVGIMNPNAEDVTFSQGNARDEMHGFFHTTRNQIVSPSNGFGKQSGKVDWFGFVNDETSFAWRPVGGEQLEYGLAESGFVYSVGESFVAAGCKATWTDHVEVIAGGPEYDGLREAIRRVDGAEAWREVTGSVKDSAGTPLKDAYVHLLDGGGKYLSRTRTDAQGAYTLHAPPGQASKLVAQSRGFPLSPGTDLAADATTADLTLGGAGTLHVTAKDATSNVALPVRVQVIPVTAAAGTPPEYGVEDERNGRLIQEFAVTGEATLRVPAGEHRVVVTRGAEWELADQTVMVSDGQTTEVPVTLEHSVDSTGWMCADFHVHSWFSADSNDPVLNKVKSAIVDGLELPISSEHEWVIDFQPIIEQLGLTQWAFSFPSQELTTFTWGHFGVVPLLPKPGELNNGAVEWIGRMPPEMFADVQSRPEDPVFIVNHPSGGAFTSYFSQAGLDASTGKGKDTKLWSNDFDAIEVFNDSDLEANRSRSVAHWFGLLNAGETMWAVGASDSHHVRSSPVGYPRTCLYFGHDDPTKLTANTVRDVLAGGTATVSGGLFMTVEGPGGEKPGATVTGAVPASADFTVTVQAASWLDATTLEVFVNGVSQKTEPLAPLGSGTAKKFVNVVTVQLDPAKPRNYVVFHAKGDKDLAPLHPGRKAFAVSNPIFFQP